MKPTVSDENLRDAVEKALEGDPEIHAKHISVNVRDGAVTLGGHVMTQHEKHAAVRATEGVEAVRAVADDIEVMEPSLHERADDEIAEEIAHLRDLHAEIEDDSVAVQVRDGRVFLQGNIESESQRDFIESTARQLTGVHAVTDLIAVTPEAESTGVAVERRIQAALEGNAQADSVRATVKDGVVRLSGELASLSALEAAVKAAEAAPGVSAVESEIVIAQEPSSRRNRD
jgi:osmotically-inducible protein OsmY